METINDIEAFVRVAELQSFSAAARALHMPKSTLSRRISRMEERLGVQLFMRSTRQISLTESGDAFYKRCQQIVADIKDAEEFIRSATSHPSGTLRLTAPSYSGSQFMSGLISQFMCAYPEVQLEVMLTNRYVNLIEEGYDIALRGGELEDSSLVARRLAPVDIVIAASPQYLEANGTPKTPQALSDHKCLVMDSSPSDRRWRASNGEVIQIQGSLLVNDLEILRHAALQHQGIIRIPRQIIERDLEEGSLTLILEEEMILQHGLYAIYPPNRFMSAKVRAFIDFAVGYFKDNPRWR